MKTISQSQRTNVFISYSHNDAKWLKRLLVHLKPLVRQGSIKLWSDEKIQPGSEWREEIRDAIGQAKVAVLLVSADFLASEFIVNNELPPLLTAAKNEYAIILPVIVSPCRFKQTASISKFQAVNSPNNPLNAIPEAEQEEIFVKVADAIEDAVRREDKKAYPQGMEGKKIIKDKEKVTITLKPGKGPQTTEKPVTELQPSATVPQDMVLIGGGWFEMGSNKGDEDEKPVHPVYVNDFSMGKYEVTRGEFLEFVGETEYRTDAEKGGGAIVFDGSEWPNKSDANWLSPYFKQSNKHPVVCVSWNDAISYCNWRSKKEGLTLVYTISKNSVSADFNANGYRLPTEAEREYAARCGEKAYEYSWGDGYPIRKRSGNIADETLKRKFPNWTIWGGYDDGYVFTAPVDSYDPNEFGLYDMSGNVWEWCWDWYGKDYYKSSPNRNPTGPTSGTSRVIRGGSWNNWPSDVRAANRNDSPPGNSSSSVGFRLSRAIRMGDTSFP